MRFDFDLVRDSIEFCEEKPRVISGLTTEELRREARKINGLELSLAMRKAKIFELICEKSELYINDSNAFQHKMAGEGILGELRSELENEVKNREIPELCEKTERAWEVYGAYVGLSDYGHTSPNSKLLLERGFSGLIEKVEERETKGGLSEEKRDLLSASKIMLGAMIRAAMRLSLATEKTNPECSTALMNIAKGAPTNSYEAMQLLILYFYLHEYIGATRVRTLGRLDVLLYPFYLSDTKDGKYTEGEIEEFLKLFLHRFWLMKVPFDLPFCLGGIDKNGNDITNKISYMTIKAYNSLNIYSPKIHIRVSKNTPKDFVLSVLKCIRGGNSSFVFINDDIGIKSLADIGIDELDARDFVPIGCYEPAVWGVEIGCTGNGGVNLPKALELVITRGHDHKTGEAFGIDCGEINDFPTLVSAVKSEIRFMTEKALEYIIELEKRYPKINVDPILTAQYDEARERGVDVYAGGAKYNNSSLYFYGIATLTDSLSAIKRLVFEERLCTLNELFEILKNNWEGYGSLRRHALRLTDKYGTESELCDKIAAEFSDFCAEICNGVPNGRGGVFKAALFSIDHYLFLGKRTMATPDGRLAGEIISKNLSATVGMDKCGVTALIGSVTKIDHSKFPNGSVLDVVLHPSAVSGESGLSAFYSILITYFKRGGFAMHCNVFDSETLKAAQKNPEKYKNLQVRVCGWNAYFISLTKTEQDAFIKQAEGAD